MRVRFGANGWADYFSAPCQHVPYLDPRFISSSVDFPPEHVQVLTLSAISPELIRWRRTAAGVDEWQPEGAFSGPDHPAVRFWQIKMDPVTRIPYDLVDVSADYPADHV